MLIVSFAVAGFTPSIVMPGGENVQVVSGFCAVASVPCGRFLQPRSTTWLNPFMGFTVTVYVVELPAVTVRSAGVGGVLDNEKSAKKTVSETVVSCPLLMPLTAKS